MRNNYIQSEQDLERNLNWQIDNGDKRICLELDVGVLGKDDTLLVLLHTALTFSLVQKCTEKNRNKANTMER